MCPWPKGVTPGPMAGKHHSPETRAKLCLARGVRILSKETCERISRSLTGRPRPLDVRERISATQKGKPRPWTTGDNNPMKRPEVRAKLSAAKMGHQVSPETRRKLSAYRGEKASRWGVRGEESPTWKGGVSFDPYCPRFNEEFKERVRAFFGYRCVICGKTQLENGKKLGAHHIDYLKEACCDEEIPRLFAALCHSCHSKTNFNRERWRVELRQHIETKYCGKCYLPKPVEVI